MSGAVEPTTAEGATSSASTASAALVELAAKALALTAAALPLVGYGVRYISFQVDPSIRNVLQLATALPLIDATALGLFTLLAPVAILAILFFSANAYVAVEEERLALLEQRELQAADAQAIVERLDALRVAAKAYEEVQGNPEAPLSPALASELAAIEEAAARHKALRQELGDRVDAFGTHPWFRPYRLASRLGIGPRALSVALSTFNAAVIIALMLLLPGFPATLFMFLGAALGMVIFNQRVRRRGDLRLRNVWPAVAVILIAMTLAEGFTNSGPRPATYMFDAGSPVIASGRFGELGRRDGFVFLRSCERPESGYLAIPESRIALVRVEPPGPRHRGGPSLVGLLFGGDSMTLGATGQCAVGS